MDVYVMEKALLESIVDECSARGDRDFVKDALVKKMTGLRIYGYEYTGYTDKIDSLKAYYRNNMNFLNSDIRRELFNSKNLSTQRQKTSRRLNTEVTHCTEQLYFRRLCN